LWATALLIALVALVTLGVFFRYVLDASLSWYDEFASYLLVWLAFYGAVVTTARNRHIAFEVLVDRLGRRARTGMAVVSEAFSLVFYATLTWYGVVLVRTMGGDTAVSLAWVPMAVVYSAMPISGGLMMVVSLGRLLSLAIRGRAFGEVELSATTSSE
jgi:TRAP-type transport system small permease protein